MATVIAGIVIILIGIYATLGTIKHMKGEGDCCGGGGSSIAEPEKILEGEIIGTEVITVTGMSCSACKNRVEHVVNTIPGAACKVNLKAKTATITYDREIDMQEVIRRIEVLGYKVEK